MKNFQLLQALFTIHADNFRMLHWKACGENFDRAHAIAADYYEMLGNDIDDIVEVMMRVDIKPLTTPQCYEAKKDIELDMFEADPDEDYELEDVIKHTDSILENLLRGIGEVLMQKEYQEDGDMVGIRSYLEGLYDKYDKQANYLNKRRMKK